MSKTITYNLSKKSIDSALAELRKYQESLKRKNDVFVRRLAETGIPIVNQNIVATKGDSDPSNNTYIKLNSFGEYSEATLVVEGKDILFIEFGAGVHYNGTAGDSPHPKGEEFGYTIGSYGKGNGAKDSWTYFADSGEWVRSYGTEATMPVYKASVEMRNNIQRIAKEVFGG